MNAPNIANPVSTAARFVYSTVRSSIMRMSTIGSGTRSSAHTQPTANSALAANRPRTRPEVHPHVGPSVSASSSATSVAESSTAPGTSTRDGVFTGDSGTKRQTPSAETPTKIAPTMNTQRHDPYSTSTPESTRPSPPPTPRIAETIPTPAPTFSRGNSSKTIANESGKTAPPNPWIARKTISDQMFHAKIAATHPTKKMSRLTSRNRSLPYWSPSFPSTGVAIADTSRNAVSSHVTHAVVVPKSACRLGSAGTIIVCCSEYASPASARNASVTL